MDIVAIIGIVLGFGAIIGGNVLEGGQLSALLNTPAGVIVIGGTLGAVVLQTPLSHLRRACRLLRWVILPPRPNFESAVENVMAWSKTARKEGLLGLENILDNEEDVFVRKGLELLVDGGEAHTIRQVLETDLITRADHDLEAAQVFRSMGGYSPTIGIIGAVMGLIQVMTNLADPAALGTGIATAFVATIYGVGLANLLFLPIADRLKAQIRKISCYRSMLIEGFMGIADGENPRSIEIRLRGYLESV